MMGAAPGIAGSSRPEADGIFLCDSEFTVEFFLQINNTGGPVDVWQVDGVDAEQMLDNGSGFFYLPGRISVDRITLVQQDLAGGDPLADMTLPPAPPFDLGSGTHR
jgi:hypothetical protein